MTLVADANIAVHWTLRSSWSNQALLLLRHEKLIAPDLIVAEVASAFRNESLSAPELLGRMRDGLEFLPRWFAEFVASAELRHLAFDFAARLDHSIYDCFYLALASIRETRMVTTEEKFIRKAEMDSGLCSSIMHLADWKPPSS